VIESEADLAAEIFTRNDCDTVERLPHENRGNSMTGLVEGHAS
jgi:hypothetical protein